MKQVRFALGTQEIFYPYLVEIRFAWRAHGMRPYDFYRSLGLLGFRHLLCGSDRWVGGEKERVLSPSGVNIMKLFFVDFIIVLLLF